MVSRSFMMHVFSIGLLIYIICATCKGFSFLFSVSLFFFGVGVLVVWDFEKNKQLMGPI